MFFFGHPKPQVSFAKRNYKAAFDEQIRHLNKEEKEDKTERKKLL